MRRVLYMRAAGVFKLFRHLDIFAGWGYHREAA